MDYERAVAAAPPGWRHFSIDDVARLPREVRDHELARIPEGEPDERILRALFWTFVYHLEPERWDELARHEPIHPAIVEALPRGLETGVDVGAGSGRLTAHLVRRCQKVIAVEPSAGLRAMLVDRLPSVQVHDAWADALPLADAACDLVAACGLVGPDHIVLEELHRVARPGGWIALVSPEQPEWFEAHGWRRLTAQPLEPPSHPAWIDDFFGQTDPPHELVMTRRLP